MDVFWHMNYRKTSAFVAATNEEEKKSLSELYRRAVTREIPAELLTKEQAITKEPNLSEDVLYDEEDSNLFKGDLN